jgi:hypothetical protein
MNSNNGIMNMNDAKQKIHRKFFRFPILQYSLFNIPMFFIIQAFRNDTCHQRDWFCQRNGKEEPAAGESLVKKEGIDP